MKPPLIFTPRSKLAYAIELLFTLAMWSVFIYLFLRGVLETLKTTSVLTAIEEGDLLSASTGNLAAYALIALVNGTIVVAWAQYNAYRCREERRKPVANLSTMELAASFGISQAVVHAMHAARVMTVQHDEHGSIHQVQCWTGQPQGLDAEHSVAKLDVLRPLVPA